MARKDEKRSQVLEMMERVGLTPAHVLYDKYPHQLSGGQRQRVVIARALCHHPDLIVADEPIAMADVSVRALLLDLMVQLKQEFNLTYLFITHDLATAKYICDRIAIMYLGRIVRAGHAGARSTATRSIPTRRRCWRPCRCPTPTPAARPPCPRGRSPARSTLRPGAAFTPAAPAPQETLFPGVAPTQAGPGRRRAPGRLSPGKIMSSVDRQPARPRG